MQSEWSILDAQSHFTELLDQAQREAQIINGQDRQYVVIDVDEFRRLKGYHPGLQQVILEGPGLTDLDLKRDASTGRGTQQ